MIGRGVLVSVRDPCEADDALAAGAAVIDVKEPAAGSLGAAAPGMTAAVAARVDGRVPWTLAAGELEAGIESIVALVAAVRSLMPAGVPGPAAVKAGLAGMARRDWRGGLERLHSALPQGCGHVAVAYADFDRVMAPAPHDVIEAAARIGIGTILIDTADKRGAGLLSTRPWAELADWVALARSRALGLTLAGRLGLGDIPRVMTLAPDLVALRSGVCSNADGGDRRLGRVACDLVAAAVAAARPPAGSRR